MSDLRLSVVVPCYRRGEKVMRTVQSLLAQSLAPETYEIVLVDNGSDDETYEVLCALAERHPGRVRACQETRPGAGAARNLGVRRARADLILFLDDDMRADPRLLELHLAAHQGYRGSVLGFLETDWGPHQSRFLEFLRQSQMQNNFPFSDGDLVSYRYFYTGNVSVRREAFERVGGFDESFRVYGVEDIDLGYQLEMSGETLRFVRQAVAHHDYHPTLADFIAKRRCAGRSLAYFLLKYPHLKMHYNFGRHPWCRRTFWFVACRLANGAAGLVGRPRGLARWQYHCFGLTIHWYMYVSYLGERWRHLRSRVRHMGSYLN